MHLLSILQNGKRPEAESGDEDIKEEDNEKEDMDDNKDTDDKKDNDENDESKDGVVPDTGMKVRTLLPHYCRQLIVGRRHQKVLVTVGTY